MVPDMALFQGAITGLNAAAQMVKGLIGLKISAEVNSKIIELGGEIVSAQANASAAYAEYLSMLQKVRELEEELARVKAWETEKQRYRLIEINYGAFAFALKEDSKGTEPPHWICAKCYQDGKKSILQHNGVAFVRESKVRCSTCKAEIPDGHKSTKIQYA
jgi:hypothetical protein